MNSVVIVFDECVKQNRMDPEQPSDIEEYPVLDCNDMVSPCPTETPLACLNSNEGTGLPSTPVIIYTPAPVIDINYRCARKTDRVRTFAVFVFFVSVLKVYVIMSTVD